MLTKLQESRLAAIHDLQGWATVALIVLSIVCVTLLVWFIVWLKNHEECARCGELCKPNQYYLENRKVHPICDRCYAEEMEKEERR